MKNEAVSQIPSTNFERLRRAREIINAEGKALAALAVRLDDGFCRAVELFFQCRGCVLVTGMGKAGLVGQKISATLASTGTRSHFLHPAEAVHGDLGRIHPNDVVLMLSQSGETAEVTQLLPSLKHLAVPIVAITSRAHSQVALAADVVLDLGPVEEACRHGLAPSTSTTTMMALGDALALVTSGMRGFQPQDFAVFHPGGSLGRRLAKVEDVMRPLAECRVANDNTLVREVYVAASRPGRRTGAIMLVGSDGRLTGIFTDSDLARLLEKRRDSAIDGPVRDVMTAAPTAIRQGVMLDEAIELLADRKISELPVVDDSGRPLGLIDITDVVGLLPREHSATPSTPDSTALPANAVAGANTEKPATLPFTKQTPPPPRN